jgi:hypothetical protein
LKRLITELVTSPVLVIAIVGLLAGLALVVLGMLHAVPRVGAPFIAGGMLIGFSGALILIRLSSRTAGRPSPGGGHKLPPAQEAALAVRDAETEKVVAVGQS